MIVEADRLIAQTAQIGDGVEWEEVRYSRREESLLHGTYPLPCGSSAGYRQRPDRVSLY